MSLRALGMACLSRALWLQGTASQFFRREKHKAGHTAHNPEPGQPVMLITRFRFNSGSANVPKRFVIKVGILT